MGLDIRINLPKQGAVETYDVVIVGGGPAGLTAAIYSARGRRSTVMLERNMAGGQIALTELVENFPGFPEGISGFDLSDRMKRQAAQFGAELREITTVAAFQPEEDGCFSISTDQERIRGKAIILAPGVEAKRSGIPGEAEFVGRGVSWCATCDGALYKGRTVAVVGGGDSAVEEGMFLTRFADKVYVVHRRDELRAEKIIQERAFANDKMQFVWDSVPRRIVGGQMVEALEVQNVKTQGLTSLPVNGVFFYIGQIPNTAFLQGVVRLDPAGYILTDDLMRTSVCGVFACGDARSNPLKQIAMAVGEGSLAAVQAGRYLDELECPVPSALDRRQTWGGPDVCEPAEVVAAGDGRPAEERQPTEGGQASGGGAAAGGAPVT
jgi:thioredoxin reductase (NADPH)